MTEKCEDVKMCERASTWYTGRCGYRLLDSFDKRIHSRNVGKVGFLAMWIYRKEKRSHSLLDSRNVKGGGLAYHNT